MKETIPTIDSRKEAEKTFCGGAMPHVRARVNRPAWQNRAPVEAVHPGMTLWFTGLSSAGKTTLAQAVYQRLSARGCRVELLDGDAVRQHLSKGLGFSKEDRDENIRRIGFVAELLSRNGVIVLVSAISPYRDTRQEVRRRIGTFLEVYVNAPLAVCETRDVKGLYRQARAGALRGLTGVDDPYEPPLAAEVECRTNMEDVAESVEKILKAVNEWMQSSLEIN